MLVNILKKNLIKSVNKLYKKGEHWSLLWANDSTHTSAYTTRWLQEGCTQIVRIPAYSPDLNITENLWHDLGARIDKHHPTNKFQLRPAILDEWQRTDPKLLKRMSDSMVERCKELVRAHGHKINH